MQSNQHAEQYGFWVKLATTLALVVAGSMIFVKVYAWYRTDSASMLASLSDSIFDVAASMINFFVIRYAIMPADDDHRFGHGKAESLAGLAQAAFITGSAMLLIFHSVDRIKDPHALHQPQLAIYATLFSVVMTLLLVVVQRIAIQRTNSVAIKADSMHYQSDLLMNLAVLLAIWLSTSGYPQLDGWFAIGIAVYLIWGAKSIALESSQALMDKQLPDAFTQQVERIIRSHPAVLGVHDIRSRQSGMMTFVQFHLELQDDLSLFDAHAISENIEESISAQFENIEVLIHKDPVSVVKR
ncbi:cation diffusion facilitator family transporter [Neptunicella marina]|uniref:Cation-efflux pump FieF n=1 Tax=Neptunicella marina TaxID=2125989 RepID=A0A8J6IX50_9ALTE|nr:cation diffusion facilitator family transporter [Neptunicella marina]MBC3767629.1 cation diffusion facilitator family transporter [Neptunicella marina]